MANDYEIETPEYIKYGLNIFQKWFYADSEDEHVRKCLAMSMYRLGSEICDMGCGTGYIAHQMNLAGYKTIGVTNSPFQYRYAINHYPDTRFVLSDMAETPFPDNYFDAVQWMEAIGYVPHDKAFSEAYRILKFGGKVIVKDFFTDRDNPLWEAWSYRVVAPKELIKIAERVGFRLVRVIYPGGTADRFINFCRQSTLMQQFHPPKEGEHGLVGFWYEFTKEAV